MRSRRWLVEAVEAVEDVSPPASPRVNLACADDDAQGQTLEVYWDFEIDRRILEQEAWSSIGARGFDSPRHFSAFLHTLRWNCVTATDPNLFQSPFRAGIRIDAYQMEPLRKALRLPRVNLFIADDTGLGKTIEAGLIARELLLRKKAKTIVVGAPASVLEQWKAEMEERFGLLFVILDRAYLTRVRQERGFGVNPWRTHSRFLVSHNLLIDPTYADPMREWLGEMQPGSLLILDEAHHAAPSSGGRYGIETKFTRAIRDLGGRFEHRLFLSATPHNGHSNSFSTLLELLDPYRFTRGVPVQGKNALEDVMVRRIKEDVREVQGGFPEREVRRIAIEDLPEDAPELVRGRKGLKRNLMDVGFGVSQVLPVLAALFRADRSPMFLLQQPELHLHPSAQAALGSLFCRTAEAERQLIIETHSEYIVDRVRMDIRDRKTALTPDDVSILFFERTDHDVRIHSLRFDEQGNIVGAPDGYGQFFMDEVRRSVGI